MYCIAPHHHAAPTATPHRHHCTQADRLKAAARGVRLFGLRPDFPDVEDLYRSRTVQRLVDKRLWSVAATFVEGDRRLQVGLLQTMAAAGDLPLANEYRGLWGLPPDALVVDPQGSNYDCYDCYDFCRCDGAPCATCDSRAYSPAPPAACLLPSPQPCSFFTAVMV